METYDSQYAVEPFFFGETSKELFGCYHRPKSVPDRNCGIVMCYPIGQEYIASHRSFYQLAVQLSRIGFHVLRFDYFGCGDSAGDFEQGSLRQWVCDIQEASRTLMDRSNQTRIALLGLRMGATLAIKTAVQSDVFDTLVLWEPIVDGRRYLTELTELHKSFIQQFKGKKKWLQGTPDEVLGFPLRGELKQDLEAIQADRLRLAPGIRLLIVGNHPDGNCGEELKRFLKAHPQAENQVIGDHRIWHEELYKRLIPITTMNFVVNWIDKVIP